MKLHIICERDVGLFSLIQQVIANIPWALGEDRIPVAYFGDRTCYWTPGGYQHKNTVWEYYFEPIFPGYPAQRIPQWLCRAIADRFPSPFEVGYATEDGSFVTNHFGDHPELRGKALSIPYLIEDPTQELRNLTSTLIREYVRPRQSIREQACSFIVEHQFDEQFTIGVHARGTDAISALERRSHRRGSLALTRYAGELHNLLEIHPEAAIFVATDAKSSLQYFKHHFGSRVIAYDSIRHEKGPAAGRGPTGWIMPAYIATDRAQAAKNGEQAIIECLLLSECDYLVHNGSSLARTALLKSPQLLHTNTHRVLNEGERMRSR